MGGTHSVNILMSINLHSIGRALMNSRRLLRASEPKVEEAPVERSSVVTYTELDGAEDAGDLEHDAEWARARTHQGQSEPGAHAYYGELASRGHTPMDPQEFAR